MGAIEFNVVVVKADEARSAGIASAFNRILGLDEALAAQVIKSAPIVFLQKASKAEVKALSPRLAELSREGVEFRITARPLGKIPKVNWPIRPQFTVGGSAAGAGVTFAWDQCAFVCPSCGETYVFKRLGKLSLGEPAAAAPVSEPETTFSASSPVLQAASAPPAKASPSKTQPVIDEGFDLGAPPAKAPASSSTPEVEIDLMSEEMAPPPPPAREEAPSARKPAAKPAPAPAAVAAEETSLDEPVESLEDLSGL